MTNKGYYGWIHSLNAASIQAHQKGIEMLAEQHALKSEMLTEAKKPNRTAEGMAAKKARETADTAKRSAARKAAKSSAKKDLSDLKVDQDSEQTRAEIHSAAMRAGNGVQRLETGARLGKKETTPASLNPNVETVSRYPDYGSLTANARAETMELLRIQELQKRSSAPSDVDKDGDVDAQDVLKDVKDGKIDRVALDAPPPTRVHPPAEFQSFGQADWQVAKLNGYQDPTESQLDDQSTRQLTIPRRAPYTESVSQKIARFLRN